MEIEESAKKLPFWDKLSDEEKNCIVKDSAIRTYEKGAYLKGPNTSCLGMIFILSGSVRALLISEEGREITLFRLNTGDTCILSASCVMSQVSFETQMIASEKTEVLVVNTGTYMDIMESNINVKCFTYELATQRSSSVIQGLQQIIFDKFDQRLARFLVGECDKSGKDEITMTKEAIAKEVNTAREVVSRTLKQFADDGLIKMDHKKITVMDKNRLKNII